MSDSVVLKDFSKKREVPRFMLDGHEYVLYRALSIPSIQQLTKIGADFKLETAVESLSLFFELIMEEQYSRKLIEKLTVDKIEPLEVDQAVDIMNWALEKYGMRPTQSSSDSSNGSPTDGDGTRSADGA